MTTTLQDRGITLRPLVQTDLVHVYPWYVDEGWDLTYQELLSFFHCYPGTMTVAEHCGKLVGMFCTVVFNEKFASMGFLYIDKAYRGNRLGVGDMYEFSKTQLHSRFPTINISINSLLHMVDVYTRIGFPILSWMMTGYQGTPDITALTDSRTGISIVSVGPGNFKICEIYDSMVNPTGRTARLKYLLCQGNAKAKYALMGDKIVGFGFLQTSVLGYRLGPLYADSLDIAISLCKALLTDTSDKRKFEIVILTVPEMNKQVIDLISLLKLKEAPGLKARRMHSKEDVMLPMEKVYGLTNYHVDQV